MGTLQLQFFFSLQDDLFVTFHSSVNIEILFLLDPCCFCWT